MSSIYMSIVFFILNANSYMPGKKITVDKCLKLN